MSNKFSAALAALALSLVISLAPASAFAGGCCGDPAPAQKTEAKATKAAPKEVGNTVCPITGDKVGSMGAAQHVDYKGFRVALCCKGCKAPFLKDADKNLKKAQDSVKPAADEKK